jgi:ATP phosphoribosyltransferase regulatory subunit
VLANARAVFAAADQSVNDALAQLEALADILHSYYPQLTISFLKPVAGLALPNI